MAQLSRSIVCPLAFVLAFLASRMELSVCSVVKASVSCMDCGHGYDLSGIHVMIECNKGNQLYTAITNKDGSFEAALPLDSKPRMTTSICLAKLLGASQQYYAPRKNMFSEITMAEDRTGAYTISAPLVISSRSCSSVEKSSKCHELSSSKTINLPVPPVYGLPPTSFYVPLFPIIGIP